VSAISPPERAGLANTLVPRDLSRGDGILGSSGLPKLISGHILSETGTNGKGEQAQREEKHRGQDGGLVSLTLEGSTT
jgi:hypothetical protein